MNGLHFTMLRRITWAVIIALFVYIFINSLFEPSRAELLSASEGTIAYLKILWTNVYALVLSIVLILIGLGVLLILFVLRKTLDGGIRGAVWCLSEFILAAGVWTLTDSYFLSFVTAKTQTVALISYISFTTMFAFLFEFINDMMGKSRDLKVLCLFFYILAVLQALCFAFPVIPVIILVVPVHLGCLAGSVMVIRNASRESKLQQRPELRRLIHGFICLITIGFFALALYYINPEIHYSMIYGLGIGIFCAYLITAALIVVKRQIEHEASESAYRRLAYTDVMTGLMNKAAYIEEEKKPLTEGCIYLMIDINDLKSINDRFGHQVGDDVITMAAQYIKKHFVDGLCYRFGGDEFIVICRKYTLQQVQKLIGEMRREMNEDNQSREVPVNMAIGYALRQPSDTVEDMFQRADRSMYEDKMLQKTKTAAAV